MAGERECSVSSAGESGPVEGLTCIQSRIHCPARDLPEQAQNELSANNIRQFVDTLAEIALAIARRKEKLDL